MTAQQVRDVVVRVRCVGCGRVVVKLVLREDATLGRAYLAEAWNERRQERPAVHDGQVYRRVQPPPGPFRFGPISSTGGGFRWVCKCGRDLQRNGARLIPEFVRAAQAGDDLWLD